MAKNPNGKVPLLELDDGRLLAESDAMLLYLAEGTRFLPADRYERGLAYQWLFFEQYSHEPYIAVRRALMVYPDRAEEATPERLASTLAGGEKALRVMQEQLARTPFFAGNAMSVADIALYAYTHEAGRGGFDLAAYPAVSAWLRRVEAEPGPCADGLAAGLGDSSRIAARSVCSALSLSVAAIPGTSFPLWLRGGPGSTVDLPRTPQKSRDCAGDAGRFARSRFAFRPIRDCHHPRRCNMTTTRRWLRGTGCRTMPSATSSTSPLMPRARIPMPSRR